jgi:REP element-mobilizing transposase RayT
MLHRLYYHVIWTTRERHGIIDDGLAAFLCRFLRSVARQERAHVLEIGMVRTHVHVLVRVHPTTILPRLLQRWKGASAVIAGKERHSTEGQDLRWAKGYSIHTVGARQLGRVRDYLRSQPQRHPNERIVGWSGDTPEYEHAGGEQWRGEQRVSL